VEGENLKMNVVGIYCYLSPFLNRYIRIQSEDALALDEVRWMIVVDKKTVSNIINNNQ
jgi:hypothetical protein